MADHGQVINARTYWVTTGPDGKPAVVDQPPGGSPGLFGTGIGGGSAPAAVQYQEQTYEDGTKILSRWDAKENAWKQESIEVDSGLAAQHRENKPSSTKASPDEPVTAPKDQPKILTRTPSGGIVSQDNPNYAPPTRPETITRSTGRYERSEGQTTPVTEQVSKVQAEYDRQAQLDLQARAEAAEEAIKAAARQKILDDHWTAEEAHRKVTEEMARLQDELTKESQRIQIRGQDLSAATAREGHEVSRRGQDISAGVSQRGQDIGYEQSMVGDTIRAGEMMAAHAIPTWQIEQTDATTRGRWRPEDIPAYRPTAPMFGTDPGAFVAQAAEAARKRMPAPYRLPGADPTLRLPGA